MKTRGIIQVWLLYVVGAAALTQLVPNWRIQNLFSKGSGTAELAKAQADLKAKSDAAAQAEAHYNAAIADFQAKKTDELRYSQQMIAGIPAALRRAPASAEVTLASSLAERASKGLSAAIGDLPADRQAEIMAIVDGALSAKQAEVDAAKAQLAIRDHDLAVTDAAKKALEVQIPVIKAQADSAEKAKDAAQNVVSLKTQEVVAYADEAARQKKEAGSFSALFEKACWVVGLIVVVVVFFNFLLPLIAAEFPACGWLATLNKIGRSLTSAHP